ncbi:MAG: helix-turn-helix transcriptional regulator [Dehalococcoidia bacterium]
MDHPGDERRRELGAFLRKRREQLVRADYELPPVGRNRLAGLRREEVAYHAGVSVTWYTWLEQGRGINPSRQVLDSIAHNMRLSVAEHHYMLALAGYAPNPPGDLAPTAVAPPHIQRLLDFQAESPAFAVSPDWGIAGWNRAYEALYPNVATVAAGDRNLLFLIFTDPYVRRMLPDWEVTSGHFLAEYRAEAGPSLGHPAHTALVTRLLDASPEFAQAWNEHQIKRFSSRERTFHHPDAGDLTFEHHRLIPSDLPDVHVVIYIPIDAGTRAKMQQLIRTPGS